MLDDKLKAKLQNFWQNDLKEIKESPVRFGGLLICFIAAVILFFTDDGGGEEINLSENPAPVETVENISGDKKIVPVKIAATSDADKNITVVLGANSDSLYIHDPFKVPVEEKIEEPSPVEIPTVQPVIFAPPVAQDSIKPVVKIFLRGTAVIGDKKSALIQIISDKDSAAENLILEIGDNLDGKKIIDISQDFVTFDNGEILKPDILSP